MVLVAVAALVAAAGYGTWKWYGSANGGNEPVSPAGQEPTPVAVNTPPALPVADYQAQRQRIAEAYQNGVAALATAAEQRVAKKDQWRLLVEQALSDLSRLSAPADRRQAHQDRYILLLTLKQELGASAVNADRVKKLDESVNKSWNQ